MITSEIELLERVEELKKTISLESILLFRGQIEHYDSMRSGKSRCNALLNEEVENG